MIKPLTFVLAALAVQWNGLRHATAGTMIDTTSSWDGSNFIGGFGYPNTATYGQTVTTPNGDTVLDSFSFEMDLPANLLFRGEVYAWNGS